MIGKNTLMTQALAPGGKYVLGSVGLGRVLSQLNIQVNFSWLFNPSSLYVSVLIGTDHALELRVGNSKTMAATNTTTIPPRGIFTCMTEFSDMVSSTSAADCLPEGPDRKT